MAAPASSITTRLAYGVTQLPRVAWYLGHGLALRRLAEAARGGDGAKARRRIQTNGSVPDRNRLYADMARLFSQDFANVESGIYPLPADHDGSLGTLINRSRWNSQCVRDRSRTSFVVGKAEAIPLANNSQDAATSIFLFHELPPKVRRSTLRECARVLKPGGRLILLDSLQLDDQSDYEGLLQLFPQNYHEPYYTSYTKEDFRAPASVSKVMVFDKA